MLASLHIENIAVIKSLDVDLSGGFTALTGETGAGKSIIIDSINLLTGGRASRELVRTGEHRALVSGVFCDLGADTLETLTELGFDTDENGEILLQRTLTDDGRTTSRINGQSVTSAVYREIAQNLINIHGQNDSLQFLQKSSHLSLLDAFAENAGLLEDYRLYYAEYKRISEHLRELETEDKDKFRLLEIYRFQLGEIDSVKLKKGEEELLEAQCKKLRSAEKISKQTSFAYRILYSSDKSASASYLLDRAAASMLQISDVVPEAAELAERLKNYKYEIEDIAETIHDFSGDIDVDGDPTERLNKIEGRLDAIAKLKRKYGETYEEIQRFREETARKLDEIECADDKIADYRRQLDAVRAEMEKKAAALTNSRRVAAESILDRISDVLVYLDMPKVRFDVSIKPAEPSPNGFDDVEFLISPNPGESLRPLAKIASGGELSRIMLSMKCALADRDAVGTLIFDEVDTGISGKTSRKVGIKLKSIARGVQVICVTHSAQVASLADNHFYISKAEQDGRTETALTLLDSMGRIEEIARILGGISVTEVQRRAAAEMIAEGKEYD